MPLPPASESPVTENLVRWVRRQRLGGETWVPEARARLTHTHLPGHRGEARDPGSACPHRPMSRQGWHVVLHRLALLQTQPDTSGEMQTRAF